MSSLYVPPEIWEHILKFVKPDIKICKKCNSKVCMNCECDTGHEFCKFCNRMYCLIRNGHLNKCRVCSAKVCHKCGIHYRRRNTDWQTFTSFQSICLHCVSIQDIQNFLIADNKQLCVCNSCDANCPQELRPLMPREV